MAAHTSHTPTTLLLCRHGQSEWNVERRIQGQAPEAGGLTEQGRWEAQQLGRRLHNQGIAALYASDLLRAQETAEIVADAVGLPVQPDSRWREIDLGVWQGMQPEEVDARWPTDRIREQDLPRGEIGETFAALSARTLDAIEDLHAWHPGQSVAVICHGGNVRAALMATPARDSANPDPRRAPIANTSVTVVQVNSAGLSAAMIADTSHLDGPALETGESNADEQR